MNRPQPPYAVLIVEDEALLALDLEMIVKDAGHEVVADAMCLADVEALNGKIEPVLALVDLHLCDETTGLDVAAFIQRAWPRAIIIFVTANAAELPADLAGGHGVIAKPFSDVGVTAALKFLEAAISSPPPPAKTPGSLRTSKAFEAAWAA